MSKSQLKKTYRKELQRIVVSLKAYNPEKIILFGSMTNKDNPSNDIDLFLIKKTKISRLGKRAGEARGYLPDQSVPVDFLVYTPEEVEYELKRGNVFISEILKKGRLLYEV